MKIDYANKLREDYIKSMVELTVNNIINSAENGDLEKEFNLLKPLHDVICKIKYCDMKYIEDIIIDIAYDVDAELKLIFFDSDIMYNKDKMNFKINWK